MLMHGYTNNERETRRAKLVVTDYENYSLISRKLENLRGNPYHPRLLSPLGNVCPIFPTTLLLQQQGSSFLSVTYVRLNQEGKHFWETFVCVVSLVPLISTKFRP